MQEFQIIIFTLPFLPEPSVAIAASRAGELGVLDLEYVRDEQTAFKAIQKLVKYARNDVGLKLNSRANEFFFKITSDLPEKIKTIILTIGHREQMQEQVEFLHCQGIKVLLEATCLDMAQIGEELGVDGIIAKGNESGGRIEEETTFVLLQRFLKHLKLPIYAHGGIGLHTAAACSVAGAAGVVLDSQLALTKESLLPESLKKKIALMDGSETICLGETIGETYRIHARLSAEAVEELKQIEKRLVGQARSQSDILNAWRQAMFQHMHFVQPLLREGATKQSEGQHLLFIGQDAAFAAPLAKKFVTVGGVISGIQESINSHIQTALRLRPFDKGSPLAQSHNTQYPIVQGPMARVSDVPAFALAVAEGGALPFLALAMMRGAEIKPLLEETKRLLGDKNWGVGILGFVPPKLHSEQIEVICQVRPPFALVAGGRPDQGRILEQAGIPTYFHVPSPGLLKMFIQNGVRRFVFEGRECGGHVGPRCSFVLWETMVDTLLESLPSNSKSEDYHVLFAGGIHDALSASMVSAMAAPLAERGVRIGVQLGTAYLFTKEAVSSGAIVEIFQKEAIACDKTILLETALGHASRCVNTSYAETFMKEKQRFESEKKSAEEVRDALEDMNLGRLRIAAKGIGRNHQHGQKPDEPRLVSLSEDEQRTSGMYMVGQIAALRDKVCAIEELHHDIAVESSSRLDVLASQDVFSPSRPFASLSPSDIAIIGMACIMPKAPNLQAYWENILNRVNAITEIPKERWDWEIYYDSDPNAKDKVYSKWGAFLDDVIFDPTQYGMPPKTLYSIEPLQLLTLEVVKAALKDAGYLERSFPRERTAVIIGAGGGAADVGLRYGFRALLPQFVDTLPGLPINSEDIISHSNGKLPEWTEDSFPGILMNLLAGRVSNRFNLGGSNYVVDAACASSLAAVDAAIKELETHTSDMVIVGGADTMQSPYAYMCFSKTRALSPTGQCRTFDEKADGIVLGEGIAMLVFKRLADAERDGDRIYAVIKGTGTSSDGRNKSLTAPHPEGQALALQRAYEKANIYPDTVGLIEAHGTGPVVGDQSEVQALNQVFNGKEARKQNCAIGSVKSMIGHTKCTAGVASLVKAALALHHKVLPPTMGVDKPNPKANFPETPFYVNTEARPWMNGAIEPKGEDIGERSEHPRRAGVSAFGFGGTNFHAVLEEYTDDFMSSTQPVFQIWPSELFIWGGNGRQEILKSIESLQKVLSKGAKPQLRDLSYTLSELYKQNSLKKDSFLRLAIVATSLDDLRQKLGRAKEALAKKENSQINDPTGIYYSEQPLASEGKVVFLFPGQGSQYINMLRDLAIHFPEARNSFEKADQILREKLPSQLSAYLFPPPAFSEEEEHLHQQALTQTNIAQPAIGAASMAMFRLLSALGVLADFVAGHSYGEYVALCAASVFSEEFLIALSEARGRFIVESAGDDKGTMAAVKADARTVSEVIANIEGVNIANLNTPEQTVITGTQESVERAIEHFKAQDVLVQRLPVACAFHSPIVAPARERLAEFLSDVELKEPRIKVFSNTTAAPYPKEAKAISELLCEHLVNPVKFVQEIEALYEAGARIFVEIGPRNVLTNLVNKILENKTCLTVASDQPGRSGLLQLHHLLGQLVAHGMSVELDRLYQGRTVQQLDIDALEKDTGEKKLSPTAWLVNGTRAKPINGNLMLDKPKSSAIEAKPVVHEVMPERSEPKAEGVGERSEQTKSSLNQVSSFDTVKSELNRIVTTSSVASPSVENGNAQVMAQFQKMMNRFLDTQKNVMLTYLQGSQGAMREEEAEPQLSIHSEGEEQRGFPEKIQPSLLEKDSLTTKTDEDSRLRIQEPDTSAETAPMKDSEVLDEKKLTKLLLQIVSEKTGYPQEMLDIDLDLEADLGIDSIKRVEILGSLQDSNLFSGENRKANPVAEVATLQSEANLEGSMEELSGLKTLRDIINWIKSRFLSDTEDKKTADSRKEEEPIAESESHESDSDTHKDVKPSFEDENAVKRFTLTALPTPLNGRQTGSLAKNQVVVITDDENGIAQTMAEKLKAQGYAIAMVQMAEEFQESDTGFYTAKLTSSESVAQLLDTIRHRQGQISALIHLLPLKFEADFEKTDMGGWKRRLQLEVKSLFYLAKNLGDELRQTAQDGGACLMAATRMGGTFASVEAHQFFPSQASISGLLKSISYEWPDVRIKAVDLNICDDKSTLADQLIQEMTADDARVEVGYNDYRRLTLQLTPKPLNREEPETLKIDSSWVIMVTGGARGITADVCLYLAKQYKPTLLLIGRSPLPASEESEETASLNSPQELKAALITQMRKDAQTVTPTMVEAAYHNLLKQREMRENLASMRQAGAKVHYYQADVKEEETFSNLIDEIYQTFGRLDGVIHGAGVIEDKFIKDKTSDSFDRVFDTKVESAFILSRKLRKDSLKFLVFFSSVAGRFGNRGQCDYAAANEVYNKLAIYLDNLWPGRAISVIWGPWARTGGMVSPELQKQFAQHGIELVPRSVGPRKLDEELAYGRKGEAEVILGGGGFQEALKNHKTKSLVNEVNVISPQTSSVTLPLIGSDNIKRGQNGSVEFIRHLLPGEDLYLQHHKLDGKPVLPMAMALELMAEAALQTCPEYKVAEISDLRVLQGIVLQESDEKSLRVVAKPLSTDPRSSHSETKAKSNFLPNEGKVCVELMILDLKNPQRVHYRAVAELSSELSQPIPYEQLSLIEERAFPMNVKEAYRQWLFHGPLFQGITKIEGVGNNGIIASIVPSSPQQLLNSSSGNWLIDPVVVDCGLQLTILWGRMYWDMTTLPSRLGAFRAFSKLKGENIRCDVHVLPNSGNNIMHTNIAFLSSDGRMLGILEDMEFAASPSLNRLAGNWIYDL